MLKVAVVGIGGVSGAHIPVWISMEDIELVALCDVRLSQLEKYTDFKTYTDFDEMLNNEEIDILDICLPTFLHAEYSIKAMNKGINVICEKPISLEKSDVDRVYNCAKENNVKFMVAQVLRFWPEYEVVKNLYDTEKYGKLISGTMTRLGTSPTGSWDGWMLDEKRSGLVPFDLHIHDLDFLIYTFGTPKKINNFRARRPEQDYINAVYEFDGFFVNTEAAWYASPYPFAMRFRFQFENAVVAMEDGSTKIYERDGNTIDVFADSNDDYVNTTKVIRQYVPNSDAYANEIRYFTDCVINNTQPDKVKPDELEIVIDILRKV